MSFFMTLLKPSTFIIIVVTYLFFYAKKISQSKFFNQNSFGYVKKSNNTEQNIVKFVTNITSNR
jgi:hypothetical protein